jgi:ribose 5-phosphate isomerase A
MFLQLMHSSSSLQTDNNHVIDVTGALLREKMVEASAAKFICIVDESKLSSRGLGPGFPLPVEITPFCHEHTRRVIEGLPALKGASSRTVAHS